MIGNIRWRRGQYQFGSVASLTIYRPLLGEGHADLEQHWERMWSTRVDLQNRGIHALDLAKHCVCAQAIAAVDIALWDALGKALEQPVYKLLGGYRDRVPVIAIGGYLRSGASRPSLEEEVAHYQSGQISGMKLKVGSLSIAEDIERARLARRVGGDRFHLCTAPTRLDSGEAMTFAGG